MILSNILETMNTIRILFDLSYPKVMLYFHAFHAMQINFTYLLVIIEMCIIKYWLKFWRQRMIAMDDSFIAICITLQNVTMSSIFALAKIQIGDAEVSGFSLFGNFRVGIVIIITAAIVSFIYIGRNAFGKIKVWYESRHQVSIYTIKVSVHEPGSSKPSHTQTFRINNQSHNPGIINNKYLISFLLITFLILIPLNITTKYCFQMNVEVFTLRFQYLIICFSLATYPYCNNPSLRKFVHEYFTELFQ